MTVRSSTRGSNVGASPDVEMLMLCRFGAES
jgi:hypothetical protein